VSAQSFRIKYTINGTSAAKLEELAVEFAKDLGKA